MEARQTVDVGFEVGGRVVAVGPDEGQVVRAGALLGRLDPEAYQLEAARLAVQADRGEDLGRRNTRLYAAGGDG